MVIMRHREFSTTRKFYGAKRAAQSAAAEIHQRLPGSKQVDAPASNAEELGELTEGEINAMKRLLKSPAADRLRRNDLSEAVLGSNPNPRQPVTSRTNRVGCNFWD